MTRRNARTNTRGFTLIEMLTVIGILAIVLAIIIPTMNGARNSARKSDTRVQMTSVATAVAAFQIDNRRLPGYFSPKQMGSQLNGQRGFTQMENMMLDLLGGVTTQAPGGSIITVGPGTSTTDSVNVDLNALGSTKQSASGAVVKSYLAFDAKRYVVQNGAGNRVSSAPPEHAQFPTLVDSFGQPILAWVADETPSAGAFAAEDVTAAGANGARYYRAQNAGFLDAVNLGKLRESQTDSATGSVLTKTAASMTRSMEALLGNASQPDPSAPVATPKPLAARAPLVLHSASIDGVYVGRRDKGARPGFVAYQPNADPFGGALFDDIIVTGGN